MNKVLNKDKNLTRILAVFLVCFVLFSITQGKSFLSVSSFQSMGKLFPEFGLLSIGMALALLTCGIELCVLYTATNQSFSYLLAFVEFCWTSCSPPMLIFFFWVGIYDLYHDEVVV